MTTPNPLLSEFEFPPFDKIQPQHFKPAFLAAMEEHSRQIDAIANNSEEATFENTILALEIAGRPLARIQGIFDNMSVAFVDPVIQQTGTEMSPKLVAHKNSIFMNEALFKRVHELFAARNSNIQDDESHRLLWRYHTDFVRTGAQLTAAEDKTKFKQLSEEIASLETKFQQNVLAEVNECSVWFDNEAELEGFSSEQLAAAKEAADAAFTKEKEKQSSNVNGNGAEEPKKKGNFLVKLKNTTQQPDLADLKKPETRQKIFTASLARNSRGGANDNREIIINIARKRAERAKLLGFPSHAAYVLADEMVGTPEKALELLVRLAKPALDNARHEAMSLVPFSGKQSIEDFTGADWDFAKKQKLHKEHEEQQQQQQDQDSASPPVAASATNYFHVDSVLRNGVFFAARELYGIEFEDITDTAPKYSNDILVFKVWRGDSSKRSSLLGHLIFDLFDRSNKNQGAQMQIFQRGFKQSSLEQRPIAAVYTNFDSRTKLLSSGQVTTLFHEFGHAMHALHSETTYARLSCTEVPNDFVEFPAKIMEHFAWNPAVLRNYAKHHQTGADLPTTLFEQLTKPSAVSPNVAYETVEFLNCIILDQAWHGLSPEQAAQLTADKVDEFELSALVKFGVDKHFANVIPPRYRSCYFCHIICWAYPATYHAYLFSEVLEADGVEWFREHGGMTRENGEHLRRTVLCRGGTVDPAQMVRDFFCGRQQRVEPLLKRKGLLSA